MKTRPTDRFADEEFFLAAQISEHLRDGTLSPSIVRLLRDDSHPHLMRTADAYAQTVELLEQRKRELENEILRIETGDYT